MTALNVKNIPALMRPNAYTVHVKFPSDHDPKVYSHQTYTYATTIPGIKADDHVLVGVVDSARQTQIIKCVKVVSVDDGVEFDALDAKELRWVIDTVNVAAYTQLQCENQAIVKAYTTALARRKKTAASEALRAAMDPEAQVELDRILGVTAPQPTKAPTARRKSRKAV